MPGEHLSLSKSSLAYAKLASNPTETSWSQVYNAGNLFACLSLTLTTPDEEHASLQTIGKDLFNNLEAEFFTLEEKTLTTISEAIEKSTKHIPEDVTTNFCLAFFKENVLYLFLLGRGRVVMKRGEKLGLLIERKDDEGASLQTSSGYLQNGDTVILETNQFAKNVSDKHISDALQLELPNDIAEALSMHMHEQADGDQAAIIITYHGIGKTMPTASEEPLADEDDEEREIQENSHTKREAPALLSKIFAAAAQIRLPFGSRSRHINMRMNHRKRFFLSIIVIILVLLIVSVVMTKQKQESSKTSALFQSVYTPAFKNYDDGISLKDLNDTLSHEDLLKAEKLLKDNQDKFPKDSKESKQITDLLAKVEAALGPASEPTNTVALKEAKVDDADLLAIEKATTGGLGFSQDDTNVYYVTDETVTSISKANGKKKDLIKNDGDWDKAVGIFPYQANLYLLDQKDGILKYVGSSSGFGKSSTYLKDTVDLSKGVSIAIDSSVWILSSDGTIKKFTKGQADTFSVTGLKKPLKNPTKIYTDKDINNIYILDNGNSRIVKLENNGTFQEEYSASVMQKAKDFEVLEKDKKILILSGGKIWELPL